VRDPETKPRPKPKPEFKPVLIYDGRCRFCVAQADRLARWTGGRVRLESFRDPGVIEKYPGLTAERCEEAIQLVMPNGRIAGGAEAIARALRLRPLLAPVGFLYEAPLLRPLLDWGYRVVARNRFRIGGSTDEEPCGDEACRLHPHGGRGGASGEEDRRP
jgi:predicted DCC family thiol-disulfide oxidoreductase YuxK